MMDAIATYLLNIVAAAILCSIAISLTEKSFFARPIRLIIGLLITTSVVKPLGNIKSIDFFSISSIFSDEADTAVSAGKAAADEALHDVITERIDTYIQDKASTYGAEVAVEVNLKDNIPDSLSIEGEISPYIRSQLSAWISETFGVPKEEQYWN